MVSLCGCCNTLGGAEEAGSAPHHHHPGVHCLGLEPGVCAETLSSSWPLACLPTHPTPEGTLSWVWGQGRGRHRRFTSSKRACIFKSGKGGEVGGVSVDARLASSHEKLVPPRDG